MIAWFKREIARAPLLYAVLLVLAASWGAYANTTDAGFHFDDSHHVVGNPFVRHARYVPQFFWRPDLASALPNHRMYRPLVLCSFSWNYSMGGYDPLPWRLTAIALHSFCAVGVYLTFRVLAGQLRLRPRPARRAGALVAALFFAVHPVFTETVDYASARSSLLATMFCVWAFCCHRYARGAPPGPRRLGLWIASLALFAAALLSKEIAVVFPVLLLWAAIQERRGFVAIVPAVVVCLGYFALRQFLLGAAVIDFEARAAGIAQADPGSGGARTIIDNLYTQSRVIASYVGLFAWPQNLCINRWVRISNTPLEPGVIGGVLLIVGMLAVAWRTREKNPLLSLGLVWFLVSLAPTSSILPLNQVMNEHRLYLPGVGMAFAVAGLLRPLLARRRLVWLRPAIGGCLVVLAALTWNRNEDWRDPVRLWEDAVRVSPESDASWNSLGVQLRARGEDERAFAAFHRARELNATAWGAPFNIGTLHLQRGYPDRDHKELREAERWLLRSLEIRPRSERSRWYLAETYYGLGRIEKAESAFRELAGLSPRLYEMTRYPLARIALDRGDEASAERYYRQALGESRDPVSAWLGLAALAKRRDDLRAAEASALRAMKERPHDPRPHVFIARLYPGTARAAQHLFEAQRRGHRASDAERRSVLEGGIR